MVVKNPLTRTSCCEGSLIGGNRINLLWGGRVCCQKRAGKFVYRWKGSGKGLEGLKPFRSFSICHFWTIPLVVQLSAETRSPILKLKENAKDVPLYPILPCETPHTSVPGPPEVKMVEWWVKSHQIFAKGLRGTMISWLFHGNMMGISFIFHGNMMISWWES